MTIRAATMLAALFLCLWAGAAAADDCAAIGAVVGAECQVSQFVTASGTLTIARPLHILGTGQIKVPPAAPGQPPSSLSLNVTGALTLDAPLPGLPGGGAIVGDVQDAGAIGAVLTIVASGDISLAGDPTRGASITSNANPTDCSGNGRAGKVSVTSTGGGLVAGINTQITANAQCPGGEVAINVPSSNISIDGSVSAASGYSGFGNLTISKGGPVTIAAGCQLTLGPDSSVRSSGVKYGADRVHLESGCDTLIQGEVRSEGGINYPGLLLNETLPNKCVEGARTNKATSFPTGFAPPAWQPTGCIEIWSGGKITIESKSTGALIAESGNAAAGQNGLCCTWIDVFAKSDIAVTGPGPVGSPSFYALNARQYASHAPAGLVTVKSVNGKVTATGGGFITASGRADVTEGGGTVWIEAGGPTSLPPNSITWDTASNVDLNATWVQTRAAVASPPGTIRIRSYNGDITGAAGGLLDSRTDSGGSIALTIQGCRLPEYFTDWNVTQIKPPTINIAPVCGGFPSLPPPAELPKRPVLVTMVGGTFAWDNLPHAGTGTVQDAVTGMVITTPPLTITYVNATTGAPLPGLPIDPGVYTVVGSFPGDLNYSAATGSARLEIFVGVVSVSVTGNTCVYSGDPCLASASATIDGAPRTPTVTYNGSTTLPVNAGTYAVMATLAGQTATATVTITPLTPTITFTGDGTFVFDASAHKVTATVKGAKGVVLATLSYASANTTAFGYTPAIGTLAGPFNVCVTGCVNGGYQVTASYPGLSPNYLSATAQTAVIITKATPTVFVGSFTLVYGQSYSYNSSNAYVRGVGGPPEDLGAPTLVYKDANGALLPGAPTLPGVYSVIGAYAGTNTNYVPATGPGSVTVTGSGIVTINPLIATISLPSPVYVYNGSPQGVTATVTGPGITGGTPATVAYSGTTSASTAPTNVAVYSTQATFTRQGYVADPVSGTITITPALPVMTLTGGTFLYDGNPHPATGAVTGVGSTNLGVPTITYCPGAVTVLCASPTPAAPVAGGTYTAFGNFAASGNYAASATKTALIVINSAVVTVTGGTYTYNGQGRPATATVKDGTTGASITSPLPTLTYNGSSTVPVDAGTYNVVATFAGNTSYPGATGTGVVVINPAAPTVTLTGGIYSFNGQPHPAVGGTVTGVNGVSLGTAPITYADADGNSVAVPIQLGDYTATATYAGSRNYRSASAVAQIVIVERPVVSEPCILVDFREITLFRGKKVIMSSDAGIRSRNGIVGGFNPAVWPYDPSGKGDTTTTRTTQFRIYGFKASQLGVPIADADHETIGYPVLADPQIPGTYYIDLGQPARVIVCVSQLHTDLIDASSPSAPGVFPSTGTRTAAQRNVPGITLNHNASVIDIPLPVRAELIALGRWPTDPTMTKGVVDYVGVQLWGQGSSNYSKFVDVQVRVLTDDPVDKLTHYKFGFHTAKNVSFATFVGCSYLDSDRLNDAVRMNDVWDRTNVGNPNGWGPACGSLEPSNNQKVRENYAVPFDGIQLLAAANDVDATARIHIAPIRPLGSQPPVCTGAAPSQSMWPPNHKWVPVNIVGVTDPNGGPVTITINRILQDQPTIQHGSGNTDIDGDGVGTSTAWVRAERTGDPNFAGFLGRLYFIDFTGTAAQGGTCTGSVTVGVPHDQGQHDMPIDNGQRYDSTIPGVPRL